MAEARGLQPGQTFAAYRIESVIGRGGMGVVYLAEDERLKRKVALKILPPDMAQDKEFRDRFIRESQMAAGMDHPNIVPIFEANEVDGVLFITMRYIPGADLKDVIRNEGPLDLQRTCSLLDQVAGALDDAHDRNLVHRDVKPQNILVQRRAGRRISEHAFLTDFGLTKRRDSRTITQRGMIVGTIDYMSPEQLTAGDVDSRTDVYALGCVLYECLTGTVPYDRATEISAVAAALNDPVPRITDARPDLPKDLDQVIETALAKKREDRFESCLDLMEAAQAALGVPHPMRSEVGQTDPTPSPSATVVAPVNDISPEGTQVVPRHEGPAGEEPAATVATPSSVPSQPPTATPPPPNVASPQPRERQPAHGTIVGPRTQRSPVGMPPPGAPPPDIVPTPMPRPAKEEVTRKRRFSPLLIVLLLILVAGGAGFFIWSTLDEDDGGNQDGDVAAECVAPGNNEELGCFIRQDFGKFQFNSFADPAHTEVDFQGLASSAVYSGADGRQVTVEIIVLREIENVEKKFGQVFRDFDERFDTVVSDEQLKNDAGDNVGQIVLFRDSQDETREAVVWSKDTLVGNIEGAGLAPGEAQELFGLLPPELTTEQLELNL